MMLHSYRRRLEADLAEWTRAGLIAAEQAAAIRKTAFADKGGMKLPSVLGMLGGLLIAASVVAFVAANWQGIPRLLKLAAILGAIIAALFVAYRSACRGSERASDAAATCAALIFGAGVALVGQMYHLPADWPAGSLLVGCGALAVAALLRSDGALLTAFACMGAWFAGLTTDGAGVTPMNLLLLAPAFALALGREQRVVHHAAVLTLGLWLFLADGDLLGSQVFGAQLAYWLFIAVVATSLGALATDRGWHHLLTAFLPWGLLGYVAVLAAQLNLVLEARGLGAGIANLTVVLAGLAAVGALAALSVLARDRRSAALLAGALGLACVSPLMVWAGVDKLLMGRLVVAALVLGSTALMVAAGTSGGQRRVGMAGIAAFGLAVLALLAQTVGTLLDQSLFFLVGGVALIAIASVARRMLARITPPEGSQP
jgi:uncharacterized membrane protein